MSPVESPFRTGGRLHVEIGRDRGQPLRKVLGRDVPEGAVSCSFDEVPAETEVQLERGNGEKRWEKIQQRMKYSLQPNGLYVDGGFQMNAEEGSVSVGVLPSEPGDLSTPAIQTGPSMNASTFQTDGRFSFKEYHFVFQPNETETSQPGGDATEGEMRD